MLVATARSAKLGVLCLKLAATARRKSDADPVSVRCLTWRLLPETAGSREGQVGYTPRGPPNARKHILCTTCGSLGVFKAAVRGELMLCVWPAATLLYIDGAAVWR